MLGRSAARLLLIGVSTACLTLSLSGCDGSPTAPSAQLTGTFALASIGGVPLSEVPFAPSPASTNIEGRLLADTMTFSSNATGTRTFTSITRNVTTSVETTTTLRVTFRHTRDGDTVVLDRAECGTGCAITPAEARFTYLGDRLEIGTVDGVYRYEQVSP